MKTSLKLAISTALLSGALATTASASDKELLETLYQNGVLNKAQYEKLLSQAEEKEAASSSVSSSSSKSDEWFSNIKFSGDVRVRQEFRDRNGTGQGVRSDRQRIRARLAMNAKVNSELDAGIRIATGGEDPTSTNKSLGDGFDKKEIWVDLAYLDWRPEFAPGANLIIGKMKQPWYKVSDLVWDNDVNPEGVELKYTRDVGPVNLTAQVGYFIVQDGVRDRNGDFVADSDSYSDDLKMYHGGLSGKMKFNDMVKVSLGYNAFIYNNTNKAYFDANTGLANTQVPFTNARYGNNVKYNLHEVSGAVDVDTGMLPIKVYGHYIVNVDAADSRNDAWLAGFSTKYAGFKFNYNYRDTQRDAVMNVYNDSDFCQGNEECRGHKVSLKYDISKNFYIGGAYFDGERYDGRDYSTAQIDLGAKF